MIVSWSRISYVLHGSAVGSTPRDIIAQSRNMSIDNLGVPNISAAQRGKKEGQRYYHEVYIGSRQVASCPQRTS